VRFDVFLCNALVVLCFGNYTYLILIRRRRRTAVTRVSYDHDPSAALGSEEAIAVFMADAFETGDSAYIAKALGVVARAKGMSQIARETDLSREQLYRSFSAQGNPTLKTTLAVLHALGLELTAKSSAERGESLRT